MSRPLVRRCLTAVLGLALLAPLTAVPAAADSEHLQPVDQSTQFEDSMAVLEADSVQVTLQLEEQLGGEELLDTRAELESIAPADLQEAQQEVLTLERDLLVAEKDASADIAAPDATASPEATSSTAAATGYLGPCAMDFADVSPKHTFHRDVTWMACAGLVHGYSDHTFGVNRQITRGEVARLIYRMSGATHRPGEVQDYKDILVKRNNELFTAVSWLQEKGITTGYSDGTFRPDRPVTRGELAAYLYRFAAPKPGSVTTTAPFRDVAADHAFQAPIAWMAQKKMIAGYADGTFRPGLAVKRGETARYLYGLETVLRGAPAKPAKAPAPYVRPVVAQPVPAKPAPAQPIPLSHRYMVITDENLNVRKSPSPNSYVRASLPNSTKVIATGKTATAGGVTWREVVSGSVSGWVHGGYLIRDFEAGTAKSALASKGKVRVPKTVKGVTIVPTTWQAQPNGYWCGPASATIGLGGFGIKTTQSAMAREMLTTRDGTWLALLVRSMDYNAPAGVRYKVTTVPGKGKTATAAQRTTMRADLVRSLKAGVPAVVNIASTPNEQHPAHYAKTKGRFTLRHHMPVTGYNANTDEFFLQDPWTQGIWIKSNALADMTVTRGYGALR